MSELAGKIAKRGRAASSPARKTGGGAPRTVYDLIEQQKAEIARALPAHMTADRFARIVLTECRRTPNLLACTPQSLLGAVMLSAQLGLEPGPLGHCYLIPFRNKGVLEVQWILGYRGMIDLARRSGRIESIVAHDVLENDEFDFEYGLDETLRHRPALAGRGEAIAYYALARFSGGGHAFIVLSRDDVEQYRGRSKAKDSGPWVTDYDAMARKTAIRRLAPYLPLTVEAAHALSVDEAVRTDLGAEVLEFQPAGDVIDVEGEPAAEQSEEQADTSAEAPAVPGDGQQSITET